ncbi:MAG: carboxylating nicotinate-nucleotide diphosphorylase [Bacilli bacterium]
MNIIKLRQSLQQFLIEDLGEGDITGETIFDPKERSRGQFIVKEDGVIAGLDVIKESYHLFNPHISIDLRVRDGEEVSKETVIAEVEGPTVVLLSAERVILNLLQRMSGIATLTRKAVIALNDEHTRVCDTRKTTPGLRMIEKYAVRCGGGFNHRLGLYDGVMIKDNHIVAAGSISQAVKIAKSKLGHMVKIEVEIESHQQLLEAIEAGADVIMFDNRTPEEVREFASIVPFSITTEVSGGIDLTNIHLYGNTGANYISLGMITHSAKAFDISFNLEGGKKHVIGFN